MMHRRQFLQWFGTGLAGGIVSPRSLFAKPQAASASTTSPSAQFDHYFLCILDGFLRNARKTSTDNSYAVCSYPEGTHLPSCDTPGGKTYVSVARMIPAIAEWLAGGRAATINIYGELIDLNDVMLSIYRCAFDPKHPDYWGEPPKDKATQRTVESALVAIALWRMGDDFVGKLTPAERTNVQNWLASCTVVPERHNNHAWFTSLNQTARLVLGKKFPEFKGDEAWLIEDLKALDALFPPVNEGWYSDRADMPVYDYYNFWTFANFPLFWSRMVGDDYPEWREKFCSRVKVFLQTAPNFFAADGSYPLFGRSLLYKWALVSPMTLGYAQDLWPHSPGLLRKLVRKNLEYHWNIGSFDERLGKLRETFSEAGTPSVRERYIDNGHPYWAMLGFTFFSLPKDDPFWTANEEPLPIEKSDYTLRFEGPQMLVAGNHRTGEIRWIQAQNAPLRVTYRDQYIKFAHSSHFPYNIVADPQHAPCDQTLVFRDKQTGVSFSRTFGPGAASGELLKDEIGVRTRWNAVHGEGDAAMKFSVVSTIRLMGEFEMRVHEITAPSEAIGRFELLEGSYNVGLQSPDEAEHEEGDGWRSIRSRKTGHLVALWPLAGFAGTSSASTFDPKNETRINLVYPHVAVATMTGELTGEKMTVASLHYASPNPIDATEMHKQAAELAKKYKSSI